MPARASAARRTTTTTSQTSSSEEGQLKHRCIMAFGGPPRRHGWTQLGKLVRLDPGRGPGDAFERIWAGVVSPLVSQVALLREKMAQDDKADGGAPAAVVAGEAQDTDGSLDWRRTLAFFLYGGFYQGCAQYFIFFTLRVSPPAHLETLPMRADGKGAKRHV